MTVSVDLDNQTKCVAVEVGDETIDRLLAPEMQTYELIATQALPEHALGRRPAATHVARSLGLDVAHALPDHEMTLRSLHAGV